MREHLITALDALDAEMQDYRNRLSREPKTRGGKPNPHYAFLLKHLEKLDAANDALAEMLGVPACFDDRI